MRAKAKRMKTKLFVLLFAIALVVCAAISGSIAWLVDETSSMNSVFMVGDVNLNMGHQAEATTFSLTGTSVSDNEPIRIVPGWTVTVNDPPITVSADSEDCYLFVRIAENIGDLAPGAEFKQYLFYDAAEGWTQGNGFEIPADVYYRTVPRSINPQVFDIIKNHEVQVSGDITKAMLENLQTIGAVLPS